MTKTYTTDELQALKSEILSAMNIRFDELSKKIDNLDTKIDRKHEQVLHGINKLSKDITEHVLNRES